MKYTESVLLTAQKKHGNITAKEQNGGEDVTKRITFAIQKGGVGKTTSTVAVTETLAAAGYRVLVVDFDSQGNATKMLTKQSIYDFTGKTIMDAVRTQDAEGHIVNVKENLDLIPAEDHLAAFSRHIYTQKVNNPFKVLQRLLEPIENRYDYVFIDVGPSLGDLMINAMVYVDQIFITVDAGDLAMDAMIRFMEFVDESRAEGHTNAVISGIVLTLRDFRSKYEREISEGLRDAFGDLVMKTEVRRLVRLKEMSSIGVDIDNIADYIDLTEEIIERGMNNE